MSEKRGKFPLLYKKDPKNLLIYAFKYYIYIIFEILVGHIILCSIHIFKIFHILSLTHTLSLSFSSLSPKYLSHLSFARKRWRWSSIICTIQTLSLPVIITVNYDTIILLYAYGQNGVQKKGFSWLFCDDTLKLYTYLPSVYIIQINLSYIIYCRYTISPFWKLEIF